MSSFTEHSNVHSPKAEGLLEGSVQMCQLATLLYKNSLEYFSSDDECPCIHVYMCEVDFLTDNGGEASCGIFPCDQFVELRVVKLQTLQKRHIPSISFSAEDVKQTA